MNEITIKVRETPIFTCELCGKTDETVDLIVGGPFGSLCPLCLKMVDKIIPKYLRYLSRLSLEEIVHLIKIGKES